MLDKSPVDNMVPVARNFACHICGECFATGKALASHMRTKHFCRQIIRLYCGADLKCQSCHSGYANRQRLLAHLTDSRRPNCRDWVLQFGRRINQGDCDRLDEIDRRMMAAARTQGHTRVQAGQLQ